MALIGRLIVICFALVLAATASGILTMIALLVLELHALSGGGPAAHIFFWSGAAVGSGITVYAAILPTLIAVILAEAFSIRSMLIYAVAGAAIVLAGYYSVGLGRSYEESIDEAPAPISRTAEIAAAAGAVFGLTYWAIAGRKAGAWRRTA